MAEATPSKRINLDGGTDQGRIVGFVDGVDSFSHPTMVKATQARWLENAVTRGALLQTRPGFLQRFKFDLTPGTQFRTWWDGQGNPPIQPQMMQYFKPSTGPAQMVFAISGSLWAASFGYDGSIGAPFLIAAAAFNIYATQVVGCICVQTATIVNGQYANNIIPQTLLMMQDGINRAASWSGTSFFTYNPGKLVTTDSAGNTLFPEDSNQTIIGKWMAWSGNRLWVFNGPVGRASDLGDPTHFTEEMIQTSGGAWIYPQDVTGAIDRGISGTTNSQLVVFTRDSTWSMATGVLNRLPSAYGVGWINTPNFQTKLFSGVGCVAGKSPIVHRGLLYWMSVSGIVVFDSTGTVFTTQNLPPIDQEMDYSKRKMGPDLSGVCAGLRDSYVYWAVPVGPVTGGRVCNGHIQVLDRQTTVVHTLGLNGPYTYGTIGWQGVWTGIRPVEFVTCDVHGVNRAYGLSMDQDGNVRIWEAFQGNRADNGQQIPGLFETRMHPAASTLFETSNFRHAKFVLDQILGNLSITVSWRGMRGVWKQIFQGNLTATPGGVLSPNPTAPGPFNNNTGGTSYTVQTRDVVSPDYRGVQTACSSAGVESPYQDSRDHAFSLLVQFKGRVAILGYRIAVDEGQEDNTEGDGTPVAETGFKIVPEAGCPQAIAGTTPNFVAPVADTRLAFSPVADIVPNAEIYAAPAA